MERIYLPKRSKEVLLLIKEDKYRYIESDKRDMDLLEEEGLINPEWTCDGPFPRLLEKGEAYIYVNPNLKNPSIWEDKKYWITTVISFIALTFSIIAIFK